jgi:2-deoxystreptamine N-acetyl-D-glucosaminyltransferase/2-deoxystreptamine glucosyltransferase
MKVVVLTTSYPRHEGDYAGRFVAGVVERLRAQGVEVNVLAPGRGFRDFGLAYGCGVVHNLRRRPWVAPPAVVSIVRSLRRTARSADLVHAHWLAGGFVAALSGRPFVVTLHGTGSSGLLDEVNPPRTVARVALGRARAVIAVSTPLADAARRHGARDVEVIPNGIDVPPDVGAGADPPEVLFVGRLASEKGIEDLLAAADGLNLVIAGDGPLRAHAPGVLGFVAHAEVQELYARAAVVVCPSRSEGFGMVCAEAMAHGRAVVATRVGGLLDLVRDGETGLLVPPRDPAALRAAIDRLLADPALRRRLGAAAREHVAAHCSWERVTAATLAVYERALGRSATARRAG